MRGRERETIRDPRQQREPRRDGSRAAPVFHDPTGLTQVSMTKRCYYEVLGVARTASDEELKKA